MNEKVLKTLEYTKIIDMLASKTRSPMGAEKARELLPSSNIDMVKKRQEETEDAVKMIFTKGAIALGGLKDIFPALKRVDIGAVLSSEELISIADMARSAKNASRYFKKDRQVNDVFPSLDPIFNIISTFPHIEGEINRCIIGIDEYADDATSRLYSIRQSIKSNNARIRQRLNNIIQSQNYKNMLQEQVITTRQNRFCVPVKAEYKSRFKGIIHDQSSTGATVFIEPMAVVEIGNEIRQLEADEKNEIEKILLKLTNLVRSDLDNIRETLNALIELDFIFAKADLAMDMRAVKPKLNEDRYINLKKARHPLLDSEEVVPIDVYLGKDFTTLLVTGPNTGGKTLTLKTIGLLNVMAQAGLHIPAGDRSEVAVFDQIFADIGDEQSIEQSLSTFSSHMKNVINTIKNLSKNSLVLFDELGAGTDPIEGAALGMAILEYLRKQKITTAATTHYSELKVYALSTEGVENASCEFDVKTLSPTYKLLIGVPGKSNAFAISSKLGLPDFLIEDAQRLIEKENVNIEEIIIDLEDSKKESIKEREKAENYRKEATKLKKQIEKQKENVISEKEKLIADARFEAKKILEKAKDESDKIIRSLKAEARKSGGGANFSDRKIEGEREKLRRSIKSHDETIKEAIKERSSFSKPKNLKKGDEVKVITLNQNGIVQEEPDNSGNVLVQLGIMPMKVHISNLTLIGGDEIEKTPKRARPKKTGGRRNISKSMNISTEIDLRGQNSQEALENLDKYLDDAHLASLEQVTIIHGKGTGVLRESVTKMLRRNPHAKSYRLGEFGEGGDGVTIVELK